MLECLGQTQNLEHLVWSVYNGLISLGPTPKLVGPKSYNQWLGASLQKYSGALQVRCSAENLQLNLIQAAHTQVTVYHPCTTGPKRDSKKNWGHGHCFPKTSKIFTGEGAVGGDQNTCRPKTNLQYLGCDTDCISTGMMMKLIEFWPLLCRMLMDGKGTITQGAGIIAGSVGWPGTGHWWPIPAPGTPVLQRNQHKTSGQWLLLDGRGK